MQNVAEATIRTKMEQLRLKCNRDLHIQQQSIDAGAISFQKSLDSTKTQVQETLQFHGKIEILTFGKNQFLFGCGFSVISDINTFSHCWNRTNNVSFLL